MISAWKWRHLRVILALIAHEGDLFRSFLSTGADQLFLCNRTCIIAVLGFGLTLVLPSMTESAMSHAPKAQSGIAAGLLNVSRQVGGVIGVAILGTLVGNLQSFVSGMHLAFVIAGGVLVLALGAA